MKMNASGDQSGLSHAIEIIDKVVANPKAQALTGTGTAGMAIDYHVMEWLPEIISVVGGVLGLVLTAMMIAHKWIQIKKDLKGLKE